MIDEKKLIEDLKAKVYPEKFGEKCNAIDVISGVLQVIDEQPKTDCSECSRRKFYQQGYQDGLNADKWIPCEERLPSENGLYLATFECEDEIVVDIMFMIGKQFYYPEDAIGNFGRSVEIIAWQPLPQPYKKEGAENE